MRILLIAVLFGVVGVMSGRNAAAGDLFPDSYMIEKRVVGQLLLDARRVTGNVACNIKASLSEVDTRRSTAVVTVTIVENGEESMSRKLKLREEMLVHCPMADMMSQIVLMSVHPDGSASFEQHTYIDVNKAEIRRHSGS